MKNLKQLAAIAFVACLGMSMTACATDGIGTPTSGTTSTQTTTLGQATQAATLVTKAVTAIVQNTNLSRATLTQLNALNDALHTALTNLQADNAAGRNLNFTAFNAALAAYNSYITTNSLGTPVSATPATQ